MQSPNTGNRVIGSEPRINYLARSIPIHLEKMYIHLKRIVIGWGEDERMGWVQQSQRVYRVVEGND